MKRDIFWIMTAMVIVSASSCSLRGPAGHECLEPQARIAELHRKINQREITRQHFNGAIHRLALNCPRDLSVLMAAAEAAYQENNALAAQQYLDEVLALSKRHPAAAVLRAKIALKEGNYRYARRLIEGEIKLFPDQSVLREAQAAVEYLQGDYAAARKSVEAAMHLGAPMWRSFYHLGLIEEALGNIDEASRFYSRSSELKPDWEVPRARLAGLQAISVAPAPKLP